MAATIDGKPVFGPPRPRPSILLASLDKTSYFDELHDHLLTKLRNKADVEEATDPATVRSRLADSSRPSAILATDAALTVTTRLTLLHDIAGYVRGGGVLIFMGAFSSFARPPDIKAMFSALDLPYESGDYHRTDFRLNPAFTQFSTSGLVPVYSQKALHLANVATSDAVYLPTESARTQSHVFASNPISDHTQTPAAFCTLGMGKVGYIGDVNAERETTAVVLAMCGLQP